MRFMLAIATLSVAAALAGCGKAESIDPAEIDAENVRREEARAVEVVDASKERAANERVSVRNPDEESVAADVAREGGQTPDAGPTVTPPDGE